MKSEKLQIRAALFHEPQNRVIAAETYEHLCVRLHMGAILKKTIADVMKSSELNRK